MILEIYEVMFFILFISLLYMYKEKYYQYMNKNDFIYFRSLFIYIYNYIEIIKLNENIELVKKNNVIIFFRKNNEIDDKERIFSIEHIEKKRYKYIFYFGVFDYKYTQIINKRIKDNLNKEILKVLSKKELKKIEEKIKEDIRKNKDYIMLPNEFKGNII